MTRLFISWCRRGREFGASPTTRRSNCRKWILFELKRDKQTLVKFSPIKREGERRLTKGKTNFQMELARLAKEQSPSSSPSLFARSKGKHLVFINFHFWSSQRLLLQRSKQRIYALTFDSLGVCCVCFESAQNYFHRVREKRQALSVGSFCF